jgi:hypothetical protein
MKEKLSKPADVGMDKALIRFEARYIKSSERLRQTVKEVATEQRKTFYLEFCNIKEGTPCRTCRDAISRMMREGKRGKRNEHN